jgi:hypothetical protein
MSADVDKFLFGGGGKAARFEKIGDTVEGTITNVEVTQQTSMEDNQPLTWPDGQPRMQLVVTLQTSAKDDADDDGVRKVYAKGGKYEPAEGTGTSMKDAIADAVKKAGAKSISEGGKLKVGHTGMGKKTNRGFSAPKLFRAVYTAPVASVAASDLFDEGDEG